MQDHEAVVNSLRREKTEKTPKTKKPLVELFQKWKERTLHAVDEMATPAPDNTYNDGIDRMMMEETELLDTDEGFVQPHAVGEVAGPAPNNAC